MEKFIISIVTARDRQTNSQSDDTLGFRQTSKTYIIDYRAEQQKHII